MSYDSKEECSDEMATLGNQIARVQKILNNIEDQLNEPTPLHRFDRNTSIRICEGCKEELRRLKVYLGRKDWVQMLKENGLEKEDVIEN